MKIKYRLDKGAFTPEKAYEGDAGFDLRCPTLDDTNWGVIPANGSAKVDLGVHFEIPKNYVGFLKSKSGLNVNFGITGEGVIDSGYTGSVVAKLYNNSDKDYFFKGGDKLIQIVFLPIPEIELELTDKFEETSRGNNGFGSSGK